MRKTTACALMVAGSTACVTGARADDASASRRASITYPAGDRVHGYLRGGETHVLQVHLAKGDVYSFSVAAPGADDRLLMVLSMRDPDGREVNADAHAKHVASGKKITVGPYRVAATGTDELQLTGDGPYEGDYYATSHVRAARVTYALPDSRTTTDVPVGAGATMTLKAKKGLHSLVMTLPSGGTNEFPGNDDFVTSLRAGGLTSSSTGTDGFSSPGQPGAVTLTVQRPKWKPNSLEFPTLPAPTQDTPSLEWVAAQWKPVVADPVTPAPVQATPQQLQQPVGGPIIAVGPSGETDARPTMYVASDMNLAGSVIPNIINGVDPPPPTVDKTVVVSTPVTPEVPVVLPPAPVVPPLPPVIITPPVAPPISTPPVDPGSGSTPPVSTPPVSTPPVDPSAGSGQPEPVPPKLLTLPHSLDTALDYRSAVPSLACSNAIGMSMLVNGGLGFRDGPWAARPANYPAEFRGGLSLFRGNPLSGTDDAGPYFKRTYTSPGGTYLWTGSYVTIARYFVDGHPVGPTLATDGDTTVQWTISGSGTWKGENWTLEGSWSSVIHSTTVPGSAIYARQCTLNGGEKFVVGDLSETISTSDLTLSFTKYFRWDVAGTITNVLDLPSYGVRQTEKRVMQPAVVISTLTRTKVVDVTLTTIDASKADDQNNGEVDVTQEFQSTERGYDSCG